jgi:hypothetical protein
MSDLCGTVAGMVTPKGSMSTEGETLQVSVLPYSYCYAAFCCVCLGCCEAEFGSSGGTYELSCVYAEDKVFDIAKCQTHIPVPVASSSNKCLT